MSSFVPSIDQLLVIQQRKQFRRRTEHGKQEKERGEKTKGSAENIRQQQKRRKKSKRRTIQSSFV